jgi:16S rRNA (uracil1498-N3)-methyltransferase
MPARLFVDRPLAADELFSLPEGAARHVQVLRLQPGSEVVLFNGAGGEWRAEVVRMGRSEVEVRVGAHDTADRELPLHVTLAIGMPANDRMDAVIEKATELGVAAIQPLVCERSVLRLAGERAQKKQAHWRGVAIGASEQSGRTRVPEIAPVLALPDWLASLQPASASDESRLLLSLRDAAALAGRPAATRVVTLSGPEGGLAEAEEQLARAQGFQPVSLGTRTLRADTAPLALLGYLSLSVA